MYFLIGFLVAGLSPHRTGFDSKPVLVTYVVNKVDIVPGIQFSPVSIIQRMLHTYLHVNL